MPNHPVSAQTHGGETSHRVAIFPKLWLMGVRGGTWLHKVWFVMKVPVGSWIVPYDLELPHCILSVIQMPACWVLVYTPLLTPHVFSFEI